jgi:LysM repeat protein
MPQTLIITLLLFAFVLPILGAVVLRLLGPRLVPVQLYGAAVLLLGVVITSVLVLARSDIPSLQIGNLSILLPVTAPDDSFLSLVPTTSVDQSPAPPTLATGAPVTATAVLTATMLPLDTATAVSPTAVATQTATAEATAEPTAAPTAVPTATPEPTTVPPTAIPPTAAPAPAAAQRTYTVQPGDTLLAIAKKFNTTVTAIVKANKLTPQQADALRVGQELVIP